MKQIATLLGILFLIITSCNKSNEEKQINNVMPNSPLYDEQKIMSKYSDDEREFIYDITGRKHVPYYADYFKVYLHNKNIICFIHSENKEYSGNSASPYNRAIDPDADYNIIFMDIKNKTSKIIVNDKFNNLELLPVPGSNKSEQRIWSSEEKTINDDIIDAYIYRCFILQIIQSRLTKDNIYKLIYINNGAGFEQKEYEYKNPKYPYYIYITITPNYFFVEHREMEGEGYVLINRNTGDYELLDFADEEGH